MARVLGVSPSGYYAWRTRERSAREASDEALSARVRAIHERSRGTYETPRVRKPSVPLAGAGVKICRTHARKRGICLGYGMRSIVVDGSRS